MQDLAVSLDTDKLLQVDHAVTGDFVGSDDPALVNTASEDVALTVRRDFLWS